MSRRRAIGPRSTCCSPMPPKPLTRCRRIWARRRPIRNVVRASMRRAPRSRRRRRKLPRRFPAMLASHWGSTVSMATRTIDRRGLFSGAAALAGAVIAFKRDALAEAKRPRVNLLSAARIGETDGGVVIDAEGLTGFALPGRAHALTHLASGEVVLIGRRPGAFAAIVDPQAPHKDAKLFAPASGHRFAGHAALSA